MRKRTKVFTVFACLAATAALMAFLARDTEPKYQGRSLSQWLYAFKVHDPANPNASMEAREAIRHMGTNAIPILLHWISYEPTQLRQKTLSLLPIHLRQRYYPGAGETRAGDAEMTFVILGAQARSAVPELARLAITSPPGPRAYRCVRALVDIGPEALPGLLSIATNGQALNRAYALFFIPQFGTNALPALPTLVECLEDKRDDVACKAADVLGQLVLSPSVVVPALTAQLRNTNPARRLSAAGNLAAFGTAARSAVPELQRVLTDPAPFVRKEATNALEIIAPEALTNSPAQ